LSGGLLPHGNSTAIPVVIFSIANTEHELDAAFANLASLRADAIVVAREPYFDSQRDRLVALSARYAIPASYAWREYVAAGGLMSYGNSLTEFHIGETGRVAARAS
jgi:hypothetical protein